MGNIFVVISRIIDIALQEKLQVCIAAFKENVIELCKQIRLL